MEIADAGCLFPGQLDRIVQIIDEDEIVSRSMYLLEWNLQEPSLAHAVAFILLHRAV
jgi:hypothetical protein